MWCHSRNQEVWFVQGYLQLGGQRLELVAPRAPPQPGIVSRLPTGVPYLHISRFLVAADLDWTLHATWSSEEIQETCMFLSENHIFCLKILYASQKLKVSTKPTSLRQSKDDQKVLPTY